MKLYVYSINLFVLSLINYTNTMKLFATYLINKYKYNTNSTEPLNVIIP